MLSRGGDHDTRRWWSVTVGPCRPREGSWGAALRGPGRDGRPTHGGERSSDRSGRPSVTESRARLLVEVYEGRVAAAILSNGFLEYCTVNGAQVTVLTPGAVFPPFVARYARPGVVFEHIAVDTPVSGSGWLVRWEKRLGNQLARRGWRKARRRLWELLGARLASAAAGDLAAVLEAVQPHVFVTTDVNMGLARGLVGLCRRRRIPTLGNVFSWDHPFYEQPSRPDRLTCWSPMVKMELVRRGGFEDDRVEIIGAPAFDAYLQSANVWSRAQLCHRLGFEPGRPLLLYATLGQHKKYLDETGSFRALMEEIDAGRIPGRPQVVLRLHPVSNDHYFSEYRSRPDVVFSRYEGYSPGMRWWPSQEEVILAGNLMRHADVCVSPGSTMAVEPAIFDTPIVVPVFNQFQPEAYGRFFGRHWLRKHFQLLIERQLLPFAFSAAQMRDAVCRALADRAWMREGRRVIREEVLGPLDGRATERLGRAVMRLSRLPSAQVATEVKGGAS